MPVWFDAPAAHRPSHDQVGLLQDGRLIAMGKNYVIESATNCYPLNVRVPDLRMIEYVLNVQFSCSDLNCTYPVYEAANKKITGNVVGMTIFVNTRGTGNTIFVEVIAIGPP